MNCDLLKLEQQHDKSRLLGPRITLFRSRNFRACGGCKGAGGESRPNRADQGSCGRRLQKVSARNTTGQDLLHLQFPLFCS